MVSQQDAPEQSDEEVTQSKAMITPHSDGRTGDGDHGDEDELMEEEEQPGGEDHPGGEDGNDNEDEEEDDAENEPRPEQSEGTANYLFRFV